MAAGAEMGEEFTYFVLRTQIPLDHSIESYEQMLLPQFHTCRQQSRGRNGDKTIAADKFLNHILPYLIEVLVQDGVYFIKDFPTHALSNLLRVSHYCVLRMTIDS